METNRFDGPATPPAIARDLGRRLATAQRRYVERQAVPGQGTPLTYGGLLRLYRLILAEQTAVGPPPAQEGVPA